MLPTFTQSDLKQTEEALPLAPRVRTVCLVLIALCVTGATLYFLKPILTPLFIALFLYFLLKPVTDAIARWRIPFWIAYPFLLIVLILLLLAAATVVRENIRAFEQRLPEYQQRLLAAANSYARWTNKANDEGHFDWEGRSLADLMNFSYEDAFKLFAGHTLGFMETSVLALFYLFFIYLESHKLPLRLRRALAPETASRAERVMKNIDDGIKGFLVVKTAISVGLGLTTGLICWCFGLDFWPLWAVLMFLSNYITYVGSIAALVPPIALAYLQITSPLMATLCAGLLIGARFVWIDFLEIRFSGRQLNISPVILLVSLAVFGLLWGVVGMVLAVPIITAVKIILYNFESTRHLAILGSEE